MAVCMRRIVDSEAVIDISGTGSTFRLIGLISVSATRPSI